MNDITALMQRLELATTKGCCHTLLPDDCRALVEALEAGDTENERMARDLISRNGEIEGLRKRVEEQEEIATDYGMKFQKAQDALKHQALLHQSQMEAAEKRIAELEGIATSARPYQVESGRWGCPICHYQGHESAVYAALCVFCSNKDKGEG